MTKIEFKDLLETTGIRVYEKYAPVGTKVPFIVYSWDYANFAADNTAYQRIAAATVTHYHNDYSDGEELKTAFDENDLFWNCDSDYDPTERLYIDIYTMEVIDNG